MSLTVHSAVQAMLYRSAALTARTTSTAATQRALASPYFGHVRAPLHTSPLAPHVLHSAGRRSPPPAPTFAHPAPACFSIPTHASRTPAFTERRQHARPLGLDCALRPKWRAGPGARCVWTARSCTGPQRPTDVPSKGRATLARGARQAAANASLLTGRPQWAVAPTPFAGFVPRSKFRPLPHKMGP